MSMQTTGETEDLATRKAKAYDVADRRLRELHTKLAELRRGWSNNTEQPCAPARATAYQSTMQMIHSIIDEIETIVGKPID